MSPEEALRRVGFLKDAPTSARSALLAGGVTLRLDPGEALFLEASPTRGLLVVLGGALEESKTDARGRKLTLAVHKAGASLGELPLFDGGNYPTQALALAAGARVLQVPRPVCEAVFRDHPELAWRALRSLAIQQRKLIEMLKAQALHTVRARLAAYLLARDSPSFALGETNESVAAQVGTVREVLSRTLHQFADAGLIALAGRTVTVLDRAALEALADGGAEGR